MNRRILLGFSFLLICSSMGRAKKAGTKTSSQPEISLKLLKIGNGLWEGKIWTEILTLQSSTGDLVFKTTVELDSKEEASKTLEDCVRKAARIERRTPEVDSQGKIIGERVLARFPADAGKYKSVGLVYTKGEMYYQIQSDSMESVLAYEKEILSKSKK
jgi:hypothetical protein